MGVLVTGLEAGVRPHKGVTALPDAGSEGQKTYSQFAFVKLCVHRINKFSLK
jgi:hypothetical protein